MEERKIYKKEELKALKDWFANQDLPQGLQVDKATNTPNLKETVARLFDQAEACFENPKMQGCLILLENIKAKLERHYKIFCVNGKYGIQV